MKRSLCAVLFVLSGCLFFTSGVITYTQGAAGAALRPAEQPSLSISKRASPNPAFAYHPLRFDITLHNGSLAPLDGVVISDTVPTGTSFSGSDECSMRDVNTVVCPGLHILPGEDRSVWFTVRVDTWQHHVVNDQYSAGAPGETPVHGSPLVVPIATPSPYPSLGPTPTHGPYPTITPTPPYPSPTAPPGTVPPEPTGRPTQEPEPTLEPAGQPHLVLSQSVPAEVPEPGEEMALRVTVTNDGTGAARDVVLALQMPAGLEVRDVVISPAAASEWQGNILWVAWGYLEAGATASVEVRAVVNAAAPSGIDVIATLPDYGLETRANVSGPPQVLPPTGLAAIPWWGWLALATTLVVGGLLLLQVVRRDGPGQAGRQ